MYEADEQESVMQWAAVQSGKYPELRLLFHIPNGGKRNAAEAAHFKRMGVKPGVPDLFLPVARTGWNGLFIEMKNSNGRLTDYQQKWIDALREQGYCCVVCRSFPQAAEALKKYLNGER